MEWEAGVHHESAANPAEAPVTGADDLHVIGGEADRARRATRLEVVEVHKVDSR